MTTSALHMPNFLRHGAIPSVHESSFGAMSQAFAHEEVVVRRGTRSRLPLIIAIHSRTLGPAAGGCRLRRYDTWQDGLADALRLSEAMTYKAAVAGLDFGGGKT